MAAKAKKVPVGWREWVALPDLGIPAVKAKLDTGARSSALHAFDVELIEEGGQKFVRYKIHPFQRSSRETVAVTSPCISERRVKSSSGHVTLRPVILTPVSLLGKTWPIELTLTNRDHMGFRMLLGRHAIRKLFVVDPGASFVGAKPAKRRNAREVS